MAKNQNTFNKRRREVEKRERAQEKRDRKRQRRAAPAPSSPLNPATQIEIEKPE